MTAPTVSVIVCAYKRGAALAKTINSILDQTFDDLELIVIDDASGDDTFDFIKSYADVRVRAIRNETNLNVAGSRNRGLDLARGRYIAHCDHDDWWDRQKLERQVDYLEHDPSLGLLATSLYFVTSGDRLKPEPINPDATPNFFRWRLFLRSCFLHSSIMVRADLLKKYDLRYRQDLKFADDWEFYHQMARVAAVWQLPERLTYYNLHGENWSFVAQDQMRSHGAKFLPEYMSDLVGSALTTETTADYFHSIVCGNPCQDVERLRRVGRLMTDIVTGFFDKYETSPLDRSAIKNGAATEWWRVVRATAIGLGPRVMKVYYEDGMPGWQRPSLSSVATGVARAIL